jgi:hypothetical protein
MVNTTDSLTDKGYCEQQCHFVCTVPSTALAVTPTVIIIITS